MAGVGDELLLLLHPRQDRTNHAPGKQNHKQQNQEPADARNGGRNAEHHHKGAKLIGRVHKENQAARSDRLDRIFVAVDLPGSTGDLRGILRRLFRADGGNPIEIDLQNRSASIGEDREKPGGLDGIHVHGRRKGFRFAELHRAELLVLAGKGVQNVVGLPVENDPAEPVDRPNQHHQQNRNRGHSKQNKLLSQCFLHRGISRR